MKQTYAGSCHCGRVRFEVDTELDNVRYCDCSVCRRRGARIHVVEGQDFRPLTPLEDLLTYSFHTHTAREYFCPDCYVMPFRQPRMAPGLWSINFNCVDSIDLEAIPVVRSEGSKLP